MKRTFILLIFFCFLIFCQESSTNTPQDYEDLVCELKQTLMEKNSKIFDEENTSISTEINTNELTVDLKNPNFTKGTLITSEGGVIKNSDLRIQAKSIKYINRKENDNVIHRIEAADSLMMIYKDKVFVGEKLEYDFINKSGVIYSGKTFVSPWYLSGEKIFLDKNGNYRIQNVSITTCEHIDSLWDIYAKNVTIEHKELLKASNVRFRLFKLPAIWIPSFKLNLKNFFAKPIIQYKINWDKSSGPRASLRYEAYSWKDLALFLRLDYRLKMGFGGALETEYFPSNKRTTFVTRSYLAQDMIPNDLKERRRYRYQGAYHHTSEKGKSSAYLTWDKYSDIRMPNDFKSDDFEIDTAKKTEAMWRHQKKNLISIVHSRARVNSFETIKQDIPTIYMNVRPLKSEKMGMIFYNWGSLSYLDYAYSKDICLLKSFHSFRAETHNEIYRPIQIRGINFTPKAGLIGIFYQNSPEKNPKTLASFLYGGIIQSNLYHHYASHKHVINPYLEYFGLTDPSVFYNDHYIFSIKDGYNHINLLKLGILNQVFSSNKFISNPAFEGNLFVNLFFGNSKTKLVNPKGYLTLKWNFSSTSIQTENSWNFSKHTLDFSNSRLGWTINENLAFAVEFRYRSPYDWRKADRENFILDVTHSETEMVHSPLSDKRCTFLTHMFFRINPYWNFHIQSHHGWGRSGEKGYNEIKVDLNTLLSTRWKIRLSYMHTEEDDRFTFDYFLVKF